MEGKLIKLEKYYYTLYDSDGDIVASNNPKTPTTKKLSLKNCEAVANGYDLDELADTYAIQMNLEGHCITKEQDQYFKDGFMYALEILGDKKFSEQDMYKMFIYGRSIDTAKKHLRELEDKPIDEFFNDFIQSLQPKEWDVEIETILIQSSIEGEPIWQPKLDKDGCLILKRK